MTSRRSSNGSAPTESDARGTSPRQDSTDAGGGPGQEVAGSDESGVPGSDVAVEIYSLIQESSRDKANIQAAARELTSCGDLEGAARTFDAAEASRNTLAERAGALDLTTLPEAGPLVAQLTQAWSYSAQADAAFADAARYSPCDNASSELASATELSTKSHPHKDEAARLWNELASGHGLPTIVGAQL